MIRRCFTFWMAFAVCVVLSVTTPGIAQTITQSWGNGGGTSTFNSTNTDTMHSTGWIITDTKTGDTIADNSSGGTTGTNTTGTLSNGSAFVVSCTVDQSTAVVTFTVTVQSNSSNDDYVPPSNNYQIRQYWISRGGNQSSYAPFSVVFPVVTQTLPSGTQTYTTGDSEQWSAAGAYSWTWNNDGTESYSDGGPGAGYEIAGNSYVPLTDSDNQAVYATFADIVDQTYGNNQYEQYIGLRCTPSCSGWTLPSGYILTFDYNPTASPNFVLYNSYEAIWESGLFDKTSKTADLGAMTVPATSNYGAQPITQLEIILNSGTPTYAWDIDSSLQSPATDDAIVGLNSDQPNVSGVTAFTTFSCGSN